MTFDPDMKRHRALLTIAALVLAAWLVSLPLRAAQQPLAPGTIVTVAGNGKAGYSGDGGPATQAKLRFPDGPAFDAAGNLFIADEGNYCVRRVSPEGTITTAAGTGGPEGFSGDGGPAIQARMSFATGVAFDAAGDLLITDWGNNRVRKVDLNGIITTIAGSGPPLKGGMSRYSGDGGPAMAASLPTPDGIAVDPRGNLFINEAGPWVSAGTGLFIGEARVRRVDPAGIMTTYAGGGHPADGRGDGGLATDAHLYADGGVAVDAAGNLYLVDQADQRVRRVSPDGKIATVVGGGQPADGVGDGGPAIAARLDNPWGVAVDPGGNLFIAEEHGERIRKVSPAGIISTVAGTGQAGYSGDGGPATAARLNSPSGICLDRAGNLFFSEGDRYTDTIQANGTVAGRDVGVGNNRVREVIGVAVPQ